MTPERTCAACVQLNFTRAPREAATAIAGLPLCKEHLNEAHSDPSSAAGRFLKRMSELTQE